MSQPGTKSPPVKFPKSEGTTKLKCADGCKCIKCADIKFGRAADIGSAPLSRVYTRDYKKVGRSAGDTDLITAALGNPLGL